jgi:hypothetical protein
VPTEVTALIGNIISQIPLVALTLYLWYMDRRDKQKQINYLRKENANKTEILENFTDSLDKLSLSLELIKDRLR